MRPLLHVTQVLPDGVGVGLVATRDTQPDEVLLSVPLSVVLLTVDALPRVSGSECFCCWFEDAPFASPAPFLHLTLTEQCKSAPAQTALEACATSTFG